MPDAADLHAEPLTDGFEALTLRAFNRAATTAGEGRKLTGNDVAEQFAARSDPKWSSTVEHVRLALAELAALDLLEKHVDASRNLSYSLTVDGNHELRRLEGVGGPRLGETIAHRRWRERNAAALKQVAELRRAAKVASDKILAACQSESPEALDHPDPDDRRTIAATLEDVVAELKLQLRIAGEPEPDDPR